MFGYNLLSGSRTRATLNALSNSLAIIEFDVSGRVLTANKNFCDVLGYKLEEIQGQHHSLFVESEYARSVEYKNFWTKLGRGEFDVQEYKRIGKGGREVWIQASYNPVKNAKGLVTKVVKVATDVTLSKIRSVDFEGKIDAISRSQGVIEFTPAGEIIDSNENFLSVLGYRLDEIEGRHHRIFVDPAYAQSPEYKKFWEKISHGEFIAAEFKRIGKGGREIWIQATYNPIFDLNKKVAKVVKFATDVTERVRAVSDVADGLARLAENDLETQIGRAFPAAFEQLRVDFNLVVTKLGATLRGVVETSDSIATSSQEISTASEDLARRTEQQAASLEKTSAALSEITDTVKKTADGVKHARAVVATTLNDAETSSNVVQCAVEAMGKIEKSSEEIGQIISVIDEIAFQTNLLALNAGVEAARAGESGRGFAVVATEVRALAQRSAEAAKQIKSLINASNIEVGTGVKLVAETGRSLISITGKVSGIDTVIDEIATRSQQQVIGIDGINDAVSEMDTATQQNAAMAEEATAASQSLMQEMRQLSQLVGQFRIGNTRDKTGGRGDLRNVVPHASRPSEKRMIQKAVTSVVMPTSRSAPRTKKMVVNGASTNDSMEQWSEF